MAGLGSGGRRGVRIAAAVIAAVLSLAAIALVLILHPWDRSIGTLTIHVTETDPHAHTALATEPVLHGFRQNPKRGTEVIRVDSAVRDQTIEGFGAAMTDTSAWLLEDNLSRRTRDRVVRDLFSASGIHLTSVLIPMGASDFTRDGVPYAYPSQKDPQLKGFSVAHDDPYILPVLNQALSFSSADSLTFIATPWSVPAWMKANDKLSNVGNTGTLKPADYTAYANYFVNFLLKYSAHGVSVGEVMPANEPTTATLYPGMNIPPATETTLIDRYLVPILRRRGLATQVWGADLGWGNLGYAKAIATGPAARDLAGIAWHCYYGSPAAMSEVKGLNPRLGVQTTECSPGISTVAESEVIIASLRNHASVVDLWNIALDDRGGPVQPPNHGCSGCFGLLRVDTRTHTVHTTSAYDDLAQASTYIEPGAVRVGSNTFVHYGYPGPGKDWASAGVDDVALRDPDGTMVLMAYNNAASARRVSIVWKGYTFKDTIPAGATVTFRWTPTT
jgi:glucosylceramidase